MEAIVVSEGIRTIDRRVEARRLAYPDVKRNRMPVND